MSVRACAISRSRRSATFIVDAFDESLSRSECVFSVSNEHSDVNSIHSARWQVDRRDGFLRTIFARRGAVPSVPACGFRATMLLAAGQEPVDVQAARALLGVSTTVTPEQTRRAYLRLVRQHNPESDAEGFARVREAFEILQQFQAYARCRVAHRTAPRSAFLAWFRTDS
jgi:hypothetical protein